MFQYPNQNDITARNTEYAEMQNNIGKQMRFTLYDKRGFPSCEKVGEIESIRYPEYIVKVGKKKFIISKDDYISIF